MKSFNRMMALLLVLVLVVACVPAGAVTAFAAEADEAEPTSEPINTEVPTDLSESAEVPANTDTEDEQWTGEKHLFGSCNDRPHGGYSQDRFPGRMGRNPPQKQGPAA